VKKLLTGWPKEGSGAKSTIAAEQARRGRKGLPALNNAEMSALLGEPVEASAPVCRCRASSCSTSSGTGCSRGCAGRPHQCRSCQMGGGRKEVEQVHHCCRTARRGRKGLPALNASEVAALLGEPAAAEAPAPVAAAAARRSQTRRCCSTCCWAANRGCVSLAHR